MNGNGNVDPLAAFDTHPEEPQPEEIATQRSDHPSQPEGPFVARDGQLWGFLQPITSHPKLDRIDFWRLQSQIKIGRSSNRTINDICLPGLKISNQHCMIQWDGNDSGSGVVVHDYSSNGTFINAVKIGKGKSSLIRDGNEIAFGIPVAQLDNGGSEDYRYIYRNTALSPPKDGLYAMYDLDKALGSGSFATVWSAMYKSTGEWYAIKMIKAKHGHGNGNGTANGTRTMIDVDAAARKAYAREIDIMKRLKHPNICELKEVFWQGADISLVLELVGGGDLLEHILSKQGLSEAETTDISYQLCDALAYCHREGITHRDLKPENVLLTKDDPPRIKVADFGLAKVVDSVTMLRTMCGTPSYLAPEVVLQNDHEPGYDELVDAWSVGVMIFSMLTNATPFIEDENEQELRIRIAQRKIAWNFLPENITRQCTHFMGRLLERDPKKRMGLRHSLKHQWLIDYRPTYDNSNWKPKHQHEIMPSSGDHNKDMDLAAHGPHPDEKPDDVNSYMSKLHLDHLDHLDPEDRNHMPDRTNSDGEEETYGPIPGTYVSGSSKAPLMRRAEVHKKAKEEGRQLLEPTPEMWARAAGDNINGAGPSSLNVNVNKRGHSELTPLSDDDIDTVMGGDTGDEGAARHSPRKRGRPANPPAEQPKPAGRGRGKGRPRGAKAATASEPAPPVRRSTRASARNAPR